MSLSINTITKSKATSKKRIRIGRGNAAGRGTYCGKGLKGQKCRSGVSNLKRLGMKQVLLRTPKKRGFTSHKPKNQVVNLIDINKYYKAGETVNLDSLIEKGIIENKQPKVKILGKGNLTVEKLRFEDVITSENVKSQVEKLKGEVVA